ncbi:tail fiber domain-containing protein [Micavibrio aeruginosavorus]|nr:tail fiber domain-containing protein [Micavibrio aeruginosavorus]
MQRRFVLLALASAALFILPQSAYAQEAQPGDACTTNGAVRSTGGPEQMPRRMLICNGTTWQSALEQSTAGASLLQIGNDAGSCTTAKLGRMRYDGTSTWEYCNGSTWAALGGGSASAAGANREIQFNSGGSFATDPDFTFTAGDVLVVGPNEIDLANGTIALGADPTATAWGSIGLGEGVIASGDNALATGIYTFAGGDGATAMGGYTRAAGYASFSVGEQTLATGDYSMAFGRTTMAGDGADSGAPLYSATNPGTGENAVSFGLGFVNTQNAWPRTTGDSSFGIFMGAQSNVNLSTPNTMGLFGGKMVIDSTIPATNLVADTELEIDGTLKIGSGGEACDANREGSIQYLAASDTFQVCATAGSWSAMGGGGSLSSLTAATATNTINNANFTQNWQWNTVTTGSGLALSSTSVTTGNVLSITASNTAMSGNAFLSTINSTTANAAAIQGRATGTSGGTYAGYFTNGSSSGVGVYGSAYASSGATYGVWGASSSTSSGTAGVLGQATASSGAGTGVYGAAWGTSGANRGIYGASASSAGYGGYFANTNASGGWGVYSEDDIGLAANMYLNWGATRGSTGYGIRDNAGTIECKNSGGAWAACAGGGGGSAAGADREIQFNSGGAFGASSTFKFMTDGDILLTGTQTGTASVPASGAGTRMFLDTQTMALRIGTAYGTEWDNGNIGNYSFAFGEGATASGWGSIALGGGASALGTLSLAYGDTSSAEGDGSVALGSFVHAMGAGSIAMGNSTHAGENYAFAVGDASVASGYAAAAIGGSNIAAGVGTAALGMESVATGSHSIALGHYVIAGDGQFDSGDPTLGSANDTVGEASMAIGLITSANSPGTYPMVTGDQSLGIFMGNQNAVNLATANQMSLLGGKMVIDSTIPATNLVADTELEIDGTLKIGSGGEACDASREGSIRYIAASDTFEACATAGSWSALGGGGSLSGLTAATAANTINNAAYAQAWQWNSLTTGTGLALSSSSVTSGRILSVISSGTSATGPALYVEGNGNSSSGHGIRAMVNNSSGSSYAMYGATFGSGAGVFGEATNTAATGSRGVYGLSTGINGIGMLGQATSTTGTGVYGNAMGNSGTTYGVYGTAASAAGYGGYFTNTSTGVALHAAGDIEYTGVLRDMSDIRLKDNVKPLDSALEKITQLQGISFTMKDSNTHDIEYGFSAQDVQKIYPDLVHQADDADGTLSMNYTGLIAPLVEAIKEQQKEIETLKNEIEALKSATKELEKAE